MTSAIALLPGIIALLIALFRTVEKAFIGWYLPILILLPQIFTFHVPKVPDLNFSQAAILPIFAVFLIKKGFLWTLTLCDFLIIGFVAICTYSEYINEALGSTAALFVNLLTNVVMPYGLAKGLIHRGGFSIAFAKRFISLILIDVLLSAYEEKMTVNPYAQFFQIFFPDQGAEWPTLMRYGLVRIAGPFMQPIFFCIAIGVALQLNYWLAKNKFWGTRYKYIPTPPVTKGILIGTILFLGFILTFSRGPMLGIFLGSLFIGIGFSKHPWKSFISRCFLFAICSLLVVESYQYYSEIGQEYASSDTEYTIAYRAELVEKYIDIATEQFWLGWGADSWPKLASTQSIDNNYLWVLLKHGVFALGLLLSIIFYSVFRLFFRGMSTPISLVGDRSLAFTFFGIIAGLGISLITVYMGLQIEPIFFILIGWAEGYIISKPRGAGEMETPSNYKKRYAIGEA